MKGRVTGLLACCLCTWAQASSISAEATAGRGGYVSWGLLGDLELWNDFSFLTLGYNWSRVDPDDVPSHQLSLAVDVSTPGGWTFLAGASWSPVRLQTVTVARDLFFESSSAFVGGLASAGFQHALSDSVESAFDLSVGVTRHDFQRTLHLPLRQASQADALWLGRQSLGAMFIYEEKSFLSLRATYAVYSADPLAVGKFSEGQLNAIEDRLVADRTVRAGDRLAQTLAQTLSERMLQVDAMGGLPSAPVWFELKSSVARELPYGFRGELSYAFVRYVPGQGLAHLAGTRWSWRALRLFRMWAAFALQMDVLPGSPLAFEPLGTLGFELRF